jgi:hypothetical protein
MHNADSFIIAVAENVGLLGCNTVPLGRWLSACHRVMGVFIFRIRLSLVLKREVLTL